MGPSLASGISCFLPSITKIDLGGRKKVWPKRALNVQPSETLNYLQIQTIFTFLLKYSLTNDAVRLSTCETDITGACRFEKIQKMSRADEKMSTGRHFETFC